MSSRTATLTGLGAVALWSLLALLTAATGKVPPFQLAAMSFAVAGVFGVAYAAARGRLAQARPTPRQAPVINIRGRTSGNIASPVVPSPERLALYVILGFCG